MFRNFFKNKPETSGKSSPEITRQSLMNLDLAALQAKKAELEATLSTLGEYSPDDTLEKKEARVTIQGSIGLIEIEISRHEDNKIDSRAVNDAKYTVETHH